MTHAIECRCGKLKGTLGPIKNYIHSVCYCTDCQAFPRFLGQENETLDTNGGTELIQTTPDNLTFSEGIENLACLRLTPKGLLRWYASCCNTTIANTPSNYNMPFVGVVHTCLRYEPGSLNDTFGPVRMRVFTKNALCEPKPSSQGLIGGGAQAAGMIAKARLDGSYKRTPFFDGQSGKCIVTPKILSEQELKRAKTPANQMNTKGS
ncbi:DUF6151 family protein [Halomonas sp. M20]|uniref:DUF6151 family protein n=1 Tax=Halomonas sp. M20 TaxID=2763264 RepID=UPI001D0B041D|nr:DUF6151 family protein [Halomonas sp. M20]